MKSKSIISSIVIAGLGIVSSASALPVLHGVEFHAASPADEASLVYSVNGVANSAASPKDVVGTIVRDPYDIFGGTRVTVVGFHADDQNVTTNCSVWAVTPNDSVPGSQTVVRSFSVGGNHTWTRTTKFEAAEVGVKTAFFVRCTLAGSQRARIQSIRIPSTEELGGQLSEGETPPH